MADTTSLTGFLGDVADAIRTVTGETEAIEAERFDEHIKSVKCSNPNYEKALGLSKNILGKG